MLTDKMLAERFCDKLIAHNNARRKAQELSYKQAELCGVVCKEIHMYNFIWRVAKDLDITEMRLELDSDGLLRQLSFAYKAHCFFMLLKSDQKMALKDSWVEMHARGLKLMEEDATKIYTLLEALEEVKDK
jgi:hypothetical protein